MADEVGAALLEQYSKSIDALLVSKKINKSDRMILETQRLFVMFMRTFHDDHIKVDTMWRTYKVIYRLMWVGVPLIMADFLLRLWTTLYPMAQTILHP